jgi:pheromone shutdown protein TraB
VRTTVTLEPDVAARLQKLASERGTSFKATINATLRAGLEAHNPTARPYREVTRSLGVQPGIDLTKALRVAQELEDEETLRELELRK